MVPSLWLRLGYAQFNRPVWPVPSQEFRPHGAGLSFQTQCGTSPIALPITHEHVGTVLTGQT